MAARIERLGAGDGERWRRIRLAALAEAPYAFGTKHAEAARWPAARWQAQVVEFATFVAVLGDHDVGVVRGALRQRAEARELVSMWVAPSARRQGIGRRLIDGVAAWASAAAASTLVLDVLAANAPAIALYERCGFLRFDGEEMGERTPGEIRFFRPLMR